MKTHIIITDDSSDKYLDNKPTQFWTLVTLEIVIKIAGYRYLFVVCPSYANTEFNAHWAVPHQGWPTPMSNEWEMPATINELKSLFNKKDNIDKQNHALQSCIYHYGLSNSKFEELSSFIEIKDSPRDPGIVKAYKIVRYRAKQLSDLALRNIIDKYGIRGHSFLPLAKSNNQIIYRGLPVLSNVEYIIGKLQKEEEFFFDVKTSDFIEFHKGLLFCFDLSGYGTLCKHCLSKMGTFHINGQQTWEQFTTELNWHFLRELEEVCVHHIQLTGDGFICAIPITKNCTVETALKNALIVYSNLCSYIDGINLTISDKKYTLGSRLAIHIGEYRFGKIGLTATNNPTMDGSALVEVARLEAGMRTYTYKKNLKKDHCLALSKEAITILGENFKIPVNYQELGDFKSVAKEFSTQAFLYRKSE